MTFEETTGSVLTPEAQVALDRATGSAHRHDGLLSNRAFHIKQSAVRDVFDISIRPGLISLAGGSPYLQELPLDELAEATASIIRNQGLAALQYGPGQGLQELRELACEVMAAEGILDANPADVVITTGSQSGQDVAAKVFCNPGDVVLCEDPTYVGALNAFEAYEVDLQPVAMDGDGLIPEALRERISALRAAGKSIKMLYTIPSFNNPSGITLAEERRDQIVRICRENNILVLEDNPYGLLRFDGEPLPPLRASHPEDVLYLGSFSKIFSPGMRLGWALVPRHLFRRFYLACEAVVLCPSPLTQMITAAYLRDFDWMGRIRDSRRLYAQRCAAMLAALQEHMPDGVSWTVPDGGFFIWVSLPEGIDTYPLLAEAIDAGTVFIPGTAFTPGDETSSKLRLAFSAVSPDDIAEGMRRLAPVIRRAVSGADAASGAAGA